MFIYIISFLNLFEIFDLKNLINFSTILISWCILFYLIWSQFQMKKLIRMGVGEASGLEIGFSESIDLN